MKKLLTLAFLLPLAVPAVAQADLAALEDFDGGAINLTTSTVPALDGGPGDWFGVGSRNAWPQGFPDPGVPFSLADDTVFGYSNGGPPFPDDTEGIFGQNSNLDNNYFAMSDSDEFGAEQTASWTFNISGFQDLTISIDMGGIANEDFGGYSPEADVLFTASIDGGPAQTVFDLDAVDNPGFVTRPMDAGTPSGGGSLLEVSGDNPVTKILADTGGNAGDTYLDKTPPNGTGAGELDTFTTTLNDSGSTLVLTLVANMPFEAMAFDNIVIEGMATVPVDETTWGGVKLLFR